MIKTIKLPFPDSKLMPNRANGKHWTYNSKEKKDARCMAYYLTKHTFGRTFIPEHYKAKLTITFFCPDARHRDTDNLIAAMKSAIDGISEAINIDDHKFKYGEPSMVIDRRDPRVEIKLEVIE